MILTFSESGEQIVNKIMEVLAEDHEIEYIHISDAAVLTFGEMQIDPGQRQVFQNGTEISLTTREFDILYTFARYHNQVLTVQQIYKAVTGEESVEDYHSIESSIYSIRKKLGHDVIETVRGYGYKFSKK